MSAPELDDNVVIDGAVADVVIDNVVADVVADAVVGNVVINRRAVTSARMGFMKALGGGKPHSDRCAYDLCVQYLCVQY